MPPEKTFYDKINELSNILELDNSVTKKLEKIRDILVDPDVKREFFSKDIDSAWIIPLRDGGYFNNPPSVIRDKDGGTRFPGWPESKYLARMAEYKAVEVADIFNALETDNPFTIGDMLDATLAMPVDVAARIVPKICVAAQDDSLSFFFNKASELCVCLAEGGQVASAMKLADALFTPVFEEGKDEPSKRDEHYYKAGLKDVGPVLAVLSPNKFLPKLCSWLEGFIKAKNYYDSESGRDGSTHWRPAIEEHEQNRDYDFAGVIVGVVRESIEEAVRQGKATLTEVFSYLDAYPYLVFKRIRMHLIGEFTDKDEELLRKTIMDQEMLDDYGMIHEYAMLVGKRFDRLNSEEKSTWLNWVEDGPDMDGYDEDVLRNLKRPATDEDRKSRIEYWQFEKLHWVRNHLEGEMKARYDGLVAKRGEPELVDMHTYSRGEQIGEHSPMAVEDFAGLDFSVVVGKVNDWEPKGNGHFGPTVSGLANTFVEYVANNQKVFSSQAEVLVGCKSTYVRGFIRQMSAAVEGGKDIEVSPVLELCRWVLDQPVHEGAVEGGGAHDFADTDWQWTRDVISSFTECICKARKEKMPRYGLGGGLEELLWDIISNLCRDREQSNILHDKSEDDMRTRDYLDLGINSPRGKAVEAMIEYARWVANHHKDSIDGVERVVGGIGLMPEFENEINWHIDHRNVEVLAVIGSRINVLYWIDKDWLGEIADRLFNLEGDDGDPSTAIGWAAWNAFVVWNNPYFEYYEVFQKQFEYVIQQAALVELPERSREQPMYRLGDHLVILYGRGQLDLDEADGVLQKFFLNAVPGIRRHAIGFVSRSFGDDADLPKDVIARFMKLWEFYWGNVGKTDAKEKSDDWLFGVWFASGKFPVKWAIEQLVEFSEVVPVPEPDHGVAEQLAVVADHDIETVVGLLDGMIMGDKEGWHIHGWLKPAKEILGKAMRHGGEARVTAERIINFLGRRGFMEFETLLDK